MIQFDNTITIGSVLTIFSFLVAASIAIFRREARTSSLFQRFDRAEEARREDMIRIEKRFEIISETLSKQNDSLQKIVLYDYRLDEMHRRLDDVPIQVRALIGQYIAEQSAKQRS